MRNALLCSSVVLLAFAAGCSSSTSGNGGTAGDSGTTPTGDTGGTVTDTGTASGDTGGGGGDAAACSGTGLYYRLGCEAGITAAVGKIAAAELAIPDIASYFGASIAGVAGHPTPAQIEACLVDQLATAAGGPGFTYPTTVTTSTGTFTCRSMPAAHATLFISGGSFTTFVTTAATTLQGLGVAAADITTIGTVLNGTKTDIVNPRLEDAGLETIDAGFEEADGGS
jgi:hypothetical protein